MDVGHDHLHFSPMGGEVILRFVALDSMAQSQRSAPLPVPVQEWLENKQENKEYCA